MKIAIIGYGKMGKMIEQTALQRGHQIDLIIDLDNTYPDKLELATEWYLPALGFVPCPYPLISWIIK